jgi:hypothetical protein
MTYLKLTIAAITFKNMRFFLLGFCTFVRYTQQCRIPN